MLRKYNEKNKRNIAVVVVICAIILIAFSLFMKHVSDIEKQIYTLDVNSVLYDQDKNMWNLESTANLRIKWNGAYYLQYEGQEIALNKQVVVFNNASKTINLYGKIYKINQDESVTTLENESTIDDTIVSKFYKLADRKYLLVAAEIKNEKGSFSANDYLIVELDKMGNATLTNNKVNMKTLTETKLITSAYTFDIANEIINFGDKDIDLKKIIGSTNEYKPPEEEKPNNSVGTGSGSGSNEGTSDGSNTGSSNGDSTGTGSDSNNDAGSGSGSSEGSSGSGNQVTDNKVYQDKNFSIVKNTIGTNYLNIDYSIYDPKNEYKNVYLEIENDVTKNVETYYLAKNGTNLKISRLLPNTKYNLVYKYSYIDENMNVLYESFTTSYSITTILPETYLEVTKLTNKEVYYTLYENDPLMLSANIELYIDDELKNTYTFNSDVETKAYYGTFNISDFEKFNYLTIKCTSITYATGPIDTEVLIKVKN